LQGPYDTVAFVSYMARQQRCRTVRQLTDFDCSSVTGWHAVPSMSGSLAFWLDFCLKRSWENRRSAIYCFRLPSPHQNTALHSFTVHHRRRSSASAEQTGASPLKFPVPDSLTNRLQNSWIHSCYAKQGRFRRYKSSGRRVQLLLMYFPNVHLPS